MFEFLEGFKQFNIYERAIECEHKLKTFDCITPMSVFTEAVLKAIYFNCYDVDERDIEKTTLYELFRDKEFIAVLNNEYNVRTTVINVLDEVRKCSNSFKHAESPPELTDEHIMRWFIAVYTLASCYYEKVTDKKAPVWSDKEYRKVLDNALDSSAYNELCQINNKLQEQIELAQNARNKANLEVQKLRKELENEKLKEKRNTLIAKEAPTDRIKQLEAELKIKEDEENAAAEKQNNARSELERFRSRFFTSESPFNEMYRKYEDDCRKKEYGREFLKRCGPTCSKCGAKLEIGQKDGYFWKCPNYPNGCDSKTKSINSYFTKEAKEYIRITEDSSDEYILAQDVLDTYRTPDVRYSPYPKSFEDNTPDTYFFQSSTVPAEIFNEKYRYSAENYAQFKVCTNLPVKRIGEKEKTLYSLSLRLLNRGVVLPQYQPTDIALRNKFNQYDEGTMEQLFDYIEYSRPVNPYGSPKEKAFAERYFSELLGPSWGSYVFAQAGLDALTQEYNDRFKNQRVDFLINKNGKKIIVEIDGPEHKAKRSYDNARDRALVENGFIVLRFTNEEVDREDPSIMTRLVNALGPAEFQPTNTNIDNKYLVASRICHQFKVAIVKSLEKGFINNISNLTARVNTSMFTESEIDFILKVAVAEVLAILTTYSEIYNLSIEWDMFSSNAEETTIAIGDGLKNNQNSITIRDCVIPINYLCELDEFTNNIEPVNADEETITFFLKYIFGYEEFRDGQYEAILRLLHREDTIVLLPTGSGKSVIYQLVSYIAPGMVVVISPLVSLIEDQIENLRRNNGITNAIYFASLVTVKDYRNRSESKRLMQHNSTSIIYITPERLQIPSFREDVKMMMQRNSVFAVAIDEAHCVSEWGHDFRPAYLNIGNAARRMFGKSGKVPVISALTGTASNAVLNDVRLDLGIRGFGALVQPDTFDRKELHFCVKECAARNKDAYIAEILKEYVPDKLGLRYIDFIQRNGNRTKAGIVFTPLAARIDSNYSAFNICLELKKKLPELGICSYFSSPPKYYDDATWKATIRENARMFKDNELNLLVATKAFGMGIDKANVRYIIHDGIPSSFEQYYQEVGRAGRDRNRSECILLFSPDNDKANSEILNPDLDFESFKLAYESYQEEIDNSDDVSALLYFHTNSFKGVGEEIDVIKQILIEIDKRGFLAGKRIRIRMPIDKLERDARNQIKKEAIQRKERSWIQAIVRLIVLGVINDYTYDYNQNFELTCGSMSKDSIATRFSNYVRGKDFGQAEVQKQAILNLPSEGSSLVEESAKHLIEYIYDNIEKSRRRSISEMYAAAKDALKYSEDEQDEIMRRRIVSYFSYSGENREVFQSIERSTKAGLDKLREAFNLRPDIENFSDEEIETAKTNYIMAGRYLESKPDHPGLLLAQAICWLISNEYEDVMLVNTVSAAVRFAIERYGIKPEDIFPALCAVLNLVIRDSEDAADAVIDKVWMNLTQNKLEFIRQLVASDYFGDDNMTYLVAYYANELLNRTRRKADE